jgi:hypothetical protein
MGSARRWRLPAVADGDHAVGKTTCGRALTVERDRAAYLDVDDIRQLVVAELGRNR